MQAQVSCNPRPPAAALRRTPSAAHGTPARWIRLCRCAASCMHAVPRHQRCAALAAVMPACAGVRCKCSQGKAAGAAATGGRWGDQQRWASPPPFSASRAVAHAHHVQCIGGSKGSMVRGCVGWGCGMVRAHVGVHWVHEAHSHTHSMPPPLLQAMCCLLHYCASQTAACRVCGVAAL